MLSCLQIHEEANDDGDVLVFLPGQDDIEALSQLLKENLATLRAEKCRYGTCSVVLINSGGAGCGVATASYCRR